REVLLIRVSSESATLAQQQLEADVDTALAIALQRQCCGGAADFTAMEANRAEGWRKQATPPEAAQADDRHQRPRGGAPPAQARRAKPGHEPDGVGVAGGEHRVDAGQARVSHDAAGRVVRKDQASRLRQAVRTNLVAKT